MSYIQTQSGLMVPAAFAEAPEFREVATTRDGRDITRGYVDPMALLAPQDSVLSARGGNYAIYREVLRDDQVKAVFDQRRLAVISREWEVIPGGERRQDKMAAESLREQLDEIRWDSVTDKMLYGVFYGYAVAECLWARDGSQVVLDQIRVRDRRRFGFDGAGRLRLQTMSNLMPGEELPERKFWTFATGADHDDEPYGLGLAHWLYWPVLFKRGGIKFWMVFLEKFGAPTAKGTYPTNAQPEEKHRLLAALEAIQTDSALIVPEGMAVELIEAARSGSADYTELHDRMNAAITKVVLGHTGTSDSTPGKLGAEDMAEEVRDDLVKADADLVCQSFNRTVARWLTEWNYPNAAPPQVWRRMDEDEDLTARATREKSIFDMGFKPTLAHITDTYGGEWEEKAPVAPPDTAPAAEFAENDPAPAADATAAQIARLQQEGDAAVLEWIEQVRELVMTVDSLDELRDRLIDLYPQLDGAQFAEVMGDALAAAHLAGRYDVFNGA